MSGNYQNWNADAPGGLAESMAAVREGVAQAYAATGVTQQEAHAFFVTNGLSAVPGHADVGRPGDIGSDPDIYGPDASD